MRPFYHLDSLPPIPKDLLRFNFVDIDYNVKSDIILKRSGSTLTAGRYIKIPIQDDLCDWLQQNIIREWASVGYSSISAPCLGPHLDMSRFYTLQYLITTGGDDVRTVFYEAASESLIIEPRLKFSDYDLLTPFLEHRCEPGSWYLVDGRCIHSVEGIETERIALQIGLMRHPVEKKLLISMI